MFDLRIKNYRIIISYNSDTRIFTTWIDLDLILWEILKISYILILYDDRKRIVAIYTGTSS